MGATHHNELESWQLCDQLRARLIGVTDRPAWDRHLKLKDQIRSAMNSACGNTAEGFWRYRHGEFAHLVSVAMSSLGELSSHLKEALDSSLLSPGEHRSLEQDATRARKCVSGLLRYLRSTDAPDRWRRPKGKGKGKGEGKSEGKGEAAS